MHLNYRLYTFAVVSFLALWLSGCAGRTYRPRYVDGYAYGYGGGYQPAVVAQPGLYTDVAWSEPTLVIIDPGVSVVCDNNYTAYYSSNFYWHFDGGSWYRSAVWGGPRIQVGVGAVPSTIAWRDHRRYVHYQRRHNDRVYHPSHHYRASHPRRYPSHHYRASHPRRHAPPRADRYTHRRAPRAAHRRTASPHLSRRAPRSARRPAVRRRSARRHATMQPRLSRPSAAPTRRRTTTIKRRRHRRAAGAKPLARVKHSHPQQRAQHPRAHKRRRHSTRKRRHRRRDRNEG